MVNLVYFVIASLFWNLPSLSIYGGGIFTPTPKYG